MCTERSDSPLSQLSVDGVFISAREIGYTWAGVRAGIYVQWSGPDPGLRFGRRMRGRRRVYRAGAVPGGAEKRGSIRTKEDELNKRLDVLTDPFEDLGKAEFVPLYRAIDECVSI